jgi:hypothetical protein
MLFKRTSEPFTDTVTIHVPNGAPGCTDPMRVTTADIRAIEDAPGLMSRRDRGIVAAYYRAGGE